MKIVFIAIICLSLSGCVKLSEKKYVKEVISRTDPVIILIEKFKSEKNLYPSSIEELELPEAIVSSLVRDGVNYKTWNNRSVFSVSFSSSRISTAPWCSYGSAANKWQCLQK